MKLKLLFELYWTFFKIGAVGFGGGWAILPIIEAEVVRGKHWLTPLEFNDLVAIAGSTPGPVAVNAATYIGYKLHGVLGSIAATTGVITPPFLIIILIAIALRHFIKAKIVRYFLTGLKGAVIGLLLIALFSMVKGSINFLPSWTSKIYLFVITFLVIVGIKYLQIHPIIVLLLGGVLGIVGGFLKLF